MKWLASYVVLLGLLLSYSSPKDSTRTLISTKAVKQLAWFSHKIKCSKLKALRYHRIFSHKVQRLKKYTYRLAAFNYKKSKSLVIAFSSPGTANSSYLKFIYSSGWKSSKRYLFSIEKEIFNVYFRSIRPVLLKFLKSHLRKKKFSNYNVIFTGHGLAGSIAALAAFDSSNRLKFRNLNKKNPPVVVTFGQIRVGDENFIKHYRKRIKHHYSIYNKRDLSRRIPICYFSRVLKRWNCPSKRVIKKYLKQKNFPLRRYILGALGKNKKKKLEQVLKRQRFGKIYLVGENQLKKCGRANCRLPRREQKSKRALKAHYSYFGYNFKC